MSLAAWNARQWVVWTRYSPRYGVACTPPVMCEFADKYRRKHFHQRALPRAA